jgi:hypothetical protein
MATTSLFKPIYEEMRSRLDKEFGEGRVAIHFDRPYQKNIKKLPAIYIEMSEIDPSKEPMTGEVEITTTWDIRILISPKQKDSKIVCRDACARIANRLNDAVLSDYAFPCEFRGSSDDNFDFNVPTYESWVCEFGIKLRAGVDDWDTWEFYEENLGGES